MRIVRAWACFVAALALWYGAAAAQDPGVRPLDGRYFGLTEAAGAEIEIAPSGDGFDGVFRDPSGAEQRFEADAAGGGAAETVLDMAQGTVVLRMAPLPFGLEALVIPVGQDGVVDASRTQVLFFRHESLAMPDPPADYRPPPAPGERDITANGFLASYAFWGPSGVRDGYTALSPRHRRMISLFPAVQLDVIWKLCLAPGADIALGIALRDQPVSCGEVTSTLARAQTSGRFNAFKAEVEGALETLRLAVRCADGYRVEPGQCAANSGKVAAAATSLETTGTVLGRYR